MEPIEHAPDDTALRPHDPVEKQPYTRVQRAMVQQWMAGGYLLLFAGLAMGMLISIGVPALPFALLGLIMIAPLLLATASTAVGRYRLAAFWSTLGVVLATLGALAFLYGPLDGYPLLEQVIRSTEGAICSILLALAARSMASATRQTSPRHGVHIPVISMTDGSWYKARERMREVLPQSHEGREHLAHLVRTEMPRQPLRGVEACGRTVPTAGVAAENRIIG